MTQFHPKLFWQCNVTWIHQGETLTVPDVVFCETFEKAVATMHEQFGHESYELSPVVELNDQLVPAHW